MSICLLRLIERRLSLRAPKIEYIDILIGYIGKVKFRIELLKHMNSLTLKENGFAEFVPLKGLPFSSLPYQ